MMDNRISRVNELIKKNIGDIILKDLSLKDGIFITISKVDTTPDLRYTHVFVSVFPEKELSYVFKALKNEIYKIQGKLNKKMRMRPLPRIVFKYDDTELKADEIERIFKEI